MLAPAFNQKELMKYWATPKQIRQWEGRGYLYRAGKEKIIGIDYFKENKDKDYSIILSKIKAPILIIHGKKDDVVPLRLSKDLAKKYKNIKLAILPKADHRFEDYFIQQELIKRIAKWLRKHL